MQTDTLDVTIRRGVVDNVRGEDSVSRSASEAPETSERRGVERVAVQWDVDCRGSDTFLYACIANISQLGIFVRTDTPLEPGTRIVLKFGPEGVDAPFELNGVVQWVNPVRVFALNRNPGMGVSLLAITRADRERVVRAIRTIAYLRDHTN